jgi:hypothetical protein
MLLTAIEGLVGCAPTSYHLAPATKAGRRDLPFCMFKDAPARGCLTAATMGLSLASHPDWKFGRPELVISVASEDPAWALAIADIAEVNRGNFNFTWGSRINFNQRISKESETSGFVIFSPSLVDQVVPQARASVKLSSFTVFFAGMYPIYAGEAQMIAEIGLERFWKLDGFDPWNVKRPDLSKA